MVLISEVSWDGIWWFLRTIWIQLIILSCYLVFLVSDHVSFLELIDFCLMFIKKITIEVWRLFQQIKAKKPSWKIGSSFSIKKPLKVLPKVQIDDDLDLIDEDSLLSEEDLKKPQLPPGIFFFWTFYNINNFRSFHSHVGHNLFAVNDCEVGITRKACKNCTCGRAEAEEKVEKLGVTMDQLDNPQSACGSVWFLEPSSMILMLTLCYAVWSVGLIYIQLYLIISRLESNCEVHWVS